MTLIPTGFSLVSQQLRNASVTRPAFVTWGIESFAQTDAGALANEQDTLFRTHIGPRLDSNVSIGPVTVRIGTGDEPIVGQSTNSVATGGRSGVALAPADALLVHKITARGGRRGRGRFFFPWSLVQATDLDEAGVVSSTQLTNWQTSLTAWLTAMSSASVSMHLLHAEGTSTPGAPNEVTGLRPDGLISHQQRRLVRP